jgi:hypothetical protein
MKLQDSKDKPFLWDGWEHDKQLQEDYEAGKFSPRGRRKHRSGLVILYLVPPDHDSW